MAGSLPTTAARAAGAWAGPVRVKRLAAWAGGGTACLVVVGLGVWWMAGASTPAAGPAGETARAVKERLVVTITESGEIDAKRSTNVACEVEGASTIVWVIEEGTVVKAGSDLIKLDSADLADKVSTQDMLYKTTKAAYEKADKTFLITESQRESLLSTAGLTVKFALMDLKKYLGTELAERVVKEEGKVSFEALVKEPNLGGAALQQRRKLQSDIDLAAEEVSRASVKVEWTQKLKDKGYVTGSELQADQLAFARQEVAHEQAKTALDLFLQYEFPKAAEKAFTDWQESRRECGRVDTRTGSELASAKADRDTKKEAYLLEEARLKKVQDQLEKTTIRAPQPGMVVYDTSGGRWGQQVAIEPNATVRHQQNLIKLPDLSEIIVKVKLHESVVKQAREGAPAYVTIDAYPKDRFTGRITKISIMPDRSQWWLNPSLKSYLTEITLDATPPGLKPGMSAQVEILVDTREAVLQVPIAAVFVDKGCQVVYVRTPTGLETRRVEVGLSNDRSVEIVNGLSEGEEVYLFKPDGVQELQVSEEEMRAKQEAEWKARAAEPKPPAPPVMENGSTDKNGASDKSGPSRDRPERGPRADAPAKPPTKAETGSRTERGKPS